MKNMLIAALLVLSITSIGPVFGAERILQDWSFSTATDTLGWTTVVGQLKVQEGALSIKPGAEVPKLESPLFAIDATPWQYVEVEMKTDADGTGILYFSNTTDEPYHGFRSTQYTTFNAKGDGEYHVYKVYPFWQQQKKITHIRVDTPGNDIAIKSIRIVGAAVTEAAKEASWKFKDSDCGWQPINSAAKTQASSQGWKITGDGEATILSPAIDILSDDNLWLTIRAISTTSHVMQFKWACDAMDGMSTIPIELIGDGKPHSYNINLAKSNNWQGRIMLLGVTPSLANDSKSVTLLATSVSEKPSGPAEIRVTRFGLADSFVRVGQKAKLIAEVMNTGGMDAQGVSVVVGTPDEQKSNTLLPKQISSLKPGEKKKIEWDYSAKDEGSILAVCRASANNIAGEQKSIYLKLYPKLDATATQGLKYVPEPQPVKSDYLVGAYYFPGWHTYERWAVLDEFPGRKPVLGYYREGDPEIADWQINWALEHGINFFIYDWYWSEGARSLEQGLHKAFFNSRYQDKMKFCLLWANHNAPGTSSEKDLIEVTKYWIENYFNRPNYLKINGKNVMVIFSPDRISQDMGSNAVKAAFSKIKKMCEDAGVGGLYLVASVRPYPDSIKTFENEGYDAFSGYNYPEAGNKGQVYAPYEWMVDGYKEFWNNIAGMSNVPYIPVCEPGWDSRPWHGYTAAVRTGKAPYLWQKMLENAKAFEDDPQQKLAEGKKLVFLEAWNEFGEGDYIEPHAEYGFDYLEAVREVFAPQSKKPVIIVPKDIGMGPYDLPKPEPRSGWDFSKTEDRNWTPGNMDNLSYDNNTLRFKAEGDPMIYSQYTQIDASKYKTIEIKMKTNKDDESQIFFSRVQNVFNEEQSIKFKITGDNEFHVYSIDMSQNLRWKSEIMQLRFDPNSIKGSETEIAYIKLK